MTDEGWREDYTCGNAGAFHEREVPAKVVPSVWWFEVDHAALVLGSSQPITHVDFDACRRLGIDVVRRRSGGGAVLLQPGDAIWVDVVIPTTHEHWTADVSSSAWWLGEVWRQTVTQLGMSDVTVHHGPMISTAWSGHVCFAGVGGGEVTTRFVGHRVDTDDNASTSKIVGISQRRTRAGARFQCAIHRHWRPDVQAELFAPPGPTAMDLRHSATSIDVSADELRLALMTNLHRSTRSTTA